ncbi:hypothetical protein CLV63_11236 [Murinocardiopsis flavida]|uniref:Uncharacterized protein n=1 Tax=Murinocardiopsis flavida TaxID=645275 RepID=A0A2P8DG18_9ACTN|nr:hypothetical protein [Murinocardiopsis flavida]PSK96154.1 hypothetical protein CLV63_11236 [Murinocardiopsis flavida]
MPDLAPALDRSRQAAIDAWTEERRASARTEDALRAHLGALLRDVWPAAHMIEVAFAHLGRIDYTDGRIRSVLHRPVAALLPLLHTTSDGSDLADLTTDDIELPPGVTAQQWHTIRAEVDRTLTLLLARGLPSRTEDEFVPGDELGPSPRLYLDLTPNDHEATTAT